MTIDNNKVITEQIKTMNAQKGPVSKELLEYYKETQKVQKQILETIKETQKTVPEIAAQTKIASEIVLWHLTAMKKYGKVEPILAKSGYLKYVAMHTEAKA